MIILLVDKVCSKNSDYSYNKAAVLQFINPKLAIFQKRGEKMLDAARIF